MVQWGRRTSPPAGSLCPTTIITGIAADSALVGGTGSKASRRLVSVTAMRVGALAGALFVVHAQIVYPLVIAFVLLHL